MSNTIFTVDGCIRCKITKRFMVEQGIAFDDFDINADGKEAFAKFYRANRSKIFRDRDGVEFPVFTDGKIVRQGAGVIIGHLVAGDGLDGFIDRSGLHGAWIDGFNISGGNPDRCDELISVLSYLKKNRLKIQLYTDGRNAGVLEKIVAAGDLVDRMIMEIKGPAALYAELTGKGIEAHELEQSIRWVAKCGAYQFYTVISPILRKDGQISFLSPDEVGQIARMIETATQRKKEPYELHKFDAASTTDAVLKSVEALPDSALFKYRTAARRYQVRTEIR